MRKRRLFNLILVFSLTLSLGLSVDLSTPVRPELVEGPSYSLRPAGLEESSRTTQEEFTAALGLSSADPLTSSGKQLTTGLEEGEGNAVEEPGKEGEPKPIPLPLDEAILKAIREKGWAKLRGGGYLIKPGALSQKVPRLILQGGLKKPKGLPPGVEVLRADRQTTVGQMIAFFKEHQVGGSDGVLFNSEDFTYDEMIASLPLSRPAAAAVRLGIEYRIEELEEIFGLARKVGRPLYIRSLTWIRWAGEELLFIEQA